MSTPQTPLLSVLRGNPTPAELAALLVVLTAARRAPDQPDRADQQCPTPTAGRGWGRPGGWNNPEPDIAPGAADWRRTPRTNHGRNT